MRQAVLSRAALAALLCALPVAQPASAQPECTITQITHTTRGNSRTASLSGHSIAFGSTADFTGENPSGNRQVFLFDGSAITQVTRITNFALTPRIDLDRDLIAFNSYADLTGENPEGNYEIFVASCTSHFGVPALSGAVMTLFALLLATTGALWLRRG